MGNDYNVVKTNWDDYGRKTTYYIEIRGKKFGIKTLKEDEKTIISVFLSISEKEEMENHCQKFFYDFEKICEELKLDKFSVDELKKLEQACENSDNSNYKNETIDTYEVSIKRFRETKFYILDLINKTQKNIIDINIADSNLIFDFESISNFKNRSICFIGVNGSRKSTILGQIFYEHRTKNSEQIITSENASSNCKNHNLDIKISEKSLNQSKSIYISFGLFDRVDKVDEKDYTFNIAELTETKDFTNFLTESLELHSNLLKDLENYMQKYFQNLSRKIDFSSKENLNRTFNNTSTGEKYIIIFMIIIIANIREKSLIFIDEPEVSQHPQNILNIQRFLHFICCENDSYNLIATHSPYLVQNIPSECVAIIKVINDSLQVSKFPIETFGLTYDEISRLVFDVDFSDQMYISLLNELSSEEKKEIYKDIKPSTSLLVKTILGPWTQNV